MIEVLTHGIGGAADLPIPPQLAIAGAAAALTVSFAVLALAWRTPRYGADSPGRPAPRALAAVVDSPAFRIAVRALGLALTGWLVWAAVAGQDLRINPFFYMFYIHLWVGLVPASLAFGPALKALSPWRTIAAGISRAAGTPGRGLRDYPERWGYWPAALGLFAFVWLELVSRLAADLAPTRLWFACYAGAMILGGAVYGERFFARADPFEVYSSLLARLSIWGRHEGRLVIRSPLANLATQPARPGLVAVVAVLFGSTAFDSFHDSTLWLNLTQTSSTPTLWNNLALLGFCTLTGGLFTLATRPYVAELAHSIVPIVAGYIVAHYLTYLVEDGWFGLILMSDPLSDGSNLLGTGDLSPTYWLSSQPTLLATTKVLAVVTGHVLGVIAAHDRAIALLPRRRQLTGQLPLLVVMVCFTVGGLYLLFAS